MAPKSAFKSQLWRVRRPTSVAQFEARKSKLSQDIAFLKLLKAYFNEKKRQVVIELEVLETIARNGRM